MSVAVLPRRELAVNPVQPTIEQDDAPLSDAELTKIYTMPVPQVARVGRAPSGALRHPVASRIRHVHIGVPGMSWRQSEYAQRMLVGGMATEAGEGEEEEFSGLPTTARLDTELLPDPKTVCAKVVQAVAEVLTGSRAPSSLVAWVTPQLLEQLLTRMQVLRLAETRREIPPPDQSPVTIRRVILDQPRADVAEGAVILEQSGRCRAAAARLELRRGQWRMTVLDLA